MCYIVFISHRLHRRYIKIVLRKYVIKSDNSQQETVIRHPLCSVKNSGLSGLAWCTMLIKYVLAQKQSEIKKLFVRSTVTYHQYELLRQLQTSDDRFRAMSALISAASPEKMDRNTKIRF